MEFVYAVIGGVAATIIMLGNGWSNKNRAEHSMMAHAALAILCARIRVGAVRDGYFTQACADAARDASIILDAAEIYTKENR